MASFRVSWEHCSASGVQIQQHDFVDHDLNQSAFPGILACLEWCWVKPYMDWLYSCDSCISIILCIYIYMSICYHVQCVQWDVFAEQFSKEYCIGNPLEECLPSLQGTGMESKRWICGYPWEGMLNSGDSKIFQRISIFNIQDKRLGLLDFFWYLSCLSSFCLLLHTNYIISIYKYFTRLK